MATIQALLANAAEFFNSLLNDKPVTLYYVFSSDASTKLAQPYYYSGKATAVAAETNSQGQWTQKVTFTNVR